MATISTVINLRKLEGNDVYIYLLGWYTGLKEVVGAPEALRRLAEVLTYMDTTSNKDWYQHVPARVVRDLFRFIAEKEKECQTRE
jgi:hypothetical protein